MRRVGLALVAATLASVMLALPANAKGFSVAHFSGPGLPAGGVNVDGEGGGTNPIWQLGLDSRKVKALATVGVAKRDLGPAYEGRFRMDFAPQFLVHQVVYPYADGGPWTYTPPGQRIYARLPVGWYHGSPRLRRYLISFGFPKTAPDATKPAAASDTFKRTVAAQPAPPHGSWPAWAWIAITLGVGALVLLVATRYRKRVAP
jgi:hypothetical protein